MRFASAISTAAEADRAVAEVLKSLRAGPAVSPDVAFVFFTGHHNPSAERLVERLWLKLDPQCMVGCSGEGVLGGDLEVERQPGLAVLVGQTPGVQLHPFHIGDDLDWRHVLTDEDELTERVGYGPLTRGVIGFGDPFSTPVSQFLAALDGACPNAPLVGGMASSGREPGTNLVVRNDQVFDEGFVGVSLSGPLRVEPVVSQGCRPIGKPMVITKSHDNVIEQLGGRPALEMLRQTVNAIGPQEEKLLANGLFVGRAISEYRESFGRGDFLVRNVIGVSEADGTVSAADYVRTGQTVQFQVRDAATAGEDLAALLEARRSGEPPAGALLFSCNGRGTRMFDVACHDIGQARRNLPQTPVAGFFAAGEFGPVGGKNFIHGHTASLALFRPE
ncbi:MAG TPA: FIST N-terminal domain-containing protein [Humisphaera sp.]